VNISLAIDDNTTYVLFFFAMALIVWAFAWMVRRS